MTIKEWQDKFRKLLIEMEQDLGGDMPKVTIERRVREIYSESYSTSPMMATLAEDIHVEIKFGER